MRLPALLLSLALSPMGSPPAQSQCASTVVGDLRIESFHSSTYGDQRTLRVWIPSGYEAPENAQVRYPVLYIFDGQTLFDACTAFSGETELQIDEAITGLVREKKIPPMIVVGVDSSGRRSYEYGVYRDSISDPSAPVPIGTQLPLFVANEVMPFVADRYRVTADPARTGIGGTSLGGIAALHVLLNRPDRFGVGLLESPTVPAGNGQMLRDTQFLGRGPDRVYIGVGAAELHGPQAEKFAASLRLTVAVANAGFADMAEALANNLKGAHLNKPDVTFVLDPDGHHSTESWKRRIPQALAALYGRRD